jgi:hypothetical protein
MEHMMLQGMQQNVFGTSCSNTTISTLCQTQTTANLTLFQTTLNLSAQAPTCELVHFIAEEPRAHFPAPADQCLPVVGTEAGPCGIVREVYHHQLGAWLNQPLHNAAASAGGQAASIAHASTIMGATISTEAVRF